METLTGFMIAGFIFFSGKLIASGELGVNNFFSFLAAMMLAYQPIRALATINIAVNQGSGFALRNTTDGSSGNRTLAQFGMATIYFSGAGVGYISGSNMT